MALTVDSAREAAEALERRNAEEREAERAAVTAALEEYERSRDEVCALFLSLFCCCCCCGKKMVATRFGIVVVAPFVALCFFCFCV